MVEQIVRRKDLVRLDGQKLPKPCKARVSDWHSLRKDELGHDAGVIVGRLRNHVWLSEQKSETSSYREAVGTQLDSSDAIARIISAKFECQRVLPASRRRRRVHLDPQAWPDASQSRFARLLSDRRIARTPLMPRQADFERMRPAIFGFALSARIRPSRACRDR